MTGSDTKIRHVATKLCMVKATNIGCYQPPPHNLGMPPLVPPNHSSTDLEALQL